MKTSASKKVVGYSGEMVKQCFIWGIWSFN